MNDLSNHLPILGAALPLAWIATYRDWIMAQQRDLEVQDFFDVDLLDGAWQDRADAINQALDGYQGRLGVHGPFWGFTIASHDPAIRQVVNKRLHQGLKACAAIRATHMVIHSPYTTWDYNNMPFDPAAQDGVIERAHATLGDAVRRAEDIGCTLVIENIEDKDPAIRVDLARSFKSDAVRVSIDTGHAHYAHISTGAPPVDAYVLAAGDMLSHVHVQDCDGYADRHWLPGEGSIPWAGVFGALATLDHSPRLVLELRDKARLIEGHRFLKDRGLVI